MDRGLGGSGGAGFWVPAACTGIACGASAPEAGIGKHILCLYGREARHILLRQGGVKKKTQENAKKVLTIGQAFGILIERL